MDVMNADRVTGHQQRRVRLCEKPIPLCPSRKPSLQQSRIRNLNREPECLSRNIKYRSSPLMRRGCKLTDSIACKKHLSHRCE